MTKAINKRFIALLIFLFTLLVFLLPAQSFAATNTYSNVDFNNDWNDSANWSLGAVPSDGDTVYITDSVFSPPRDPGTGQPTTVNLAHIYVGHPSTNPSPGDTHLLAFITGALGNADFYIDSVNLGVLTGDVTFHDVSWNQGDVHGNATFLDQSANATGANTQFGNIQGVVTGDAHFNTTAYDSAAPIGGVFTFSDSTAGVYAMLGGSSYWSGDVLGTVYGSDNQPITEYVFHDASAANGQDGDGNTGLITLNGNATFYDGSANTSIITGNATFYGDLSYNGANILGARTRIYDSSVAPEYRDFTNVPWTAWNDGNWTVIADGPGVVVDLTHPENHWDGTTTFISQGGACFIPSGLTPDPCSVGYYFNNAVNTNWNTLGNWWSNPTFTVPSSTLPTNGSIVYVGAQLATGPSAPVNLSHINVADSTTGGGIFGATLTGASGPVTFNDASANNGPAAGNVLFNGTSANYGDITGNATFNTTHYDPIKPAGGTFRFSLAGWSGSVSGIVYGSDNVPITNYDFNDISYISGGNIRGIFSFKNTSHVDSSALVEGNSVFNDDSNIVNSILIGNARFNDRSFCQSSVITGNATFYGQSRNLLCDISGDATFNDSSDNTGTISGSGTFVGDLSENHGTITGTKIRKYTTSVVTNRNFITDGPWTVIVEGAGVVVNVTGATFNGTTTFVSQTGGVFIPSNPGTSIPPAPSGGGGGLGTGTTTPPTTPPITPTTTPTSPPTTPLTPPTSPTTPTSPTNPSTPPISPTTPTTPPSTPPLTPPTTPVIYDLGNPTLQLGSGGSGVLELQKLLNTIFNSGLTEDGKLGQKTSDAVKLWQKNNGLEADGIVGPETKSAIYISVANFMSTKNPATNSEASSDIILETQAAKETTARKILIVVPSALVVFFFFIFFKRRKSSE